MRNFRVLEKDLRQTITTRARTFALTSILAALTLTLAACGGAGDQEDMEMSGMESSGMEMSGMEMSGMEMSGMEGSSMDQGSMQMSDMSSMLMVDGEYSDERFIDLMVPHHEGAVEMAEVALDGNAEREEIIQLSEEIVRTQNTEIEELTSIKQEEFGTTEIPETSEGDTQMMGMSSPEELAQADPFDLAFIDDMTPHHESAIDMAEVALAESENPRIQEIAQEIITGQERELAQMQQWREEWYPNS